MEKHLSFTSLNVLATAHEQKTWRNVILQGGNGMGVSFHPYTPSYACLVPITGQSDYGLASIILWGWYPDQVPAAKAEWSRRWLTGGNRYNHRKGWAEAVDNMLGLSLTEADKDALAEWESGAWAWKGFSK